MKPSAQLAAAIEVLQQVIMHHIPAQKALEAWGKEHRFAGSGDRNTIGHLVYDVLRSRASLGYIMGKDSPRALVLALYATQWESVEGLKTLLEAGDVHAPAPLTEAEITTLEAANEKMKAAPLYVRGNFPKWMELHLLNAYGEGTAHIMAAQVARAPVDIRVNTQKATREELLAELSHLNVSPCPISPLGIRISPSLRGSKGLPPCGGAVTRSVTEGGENSNLRTIPPSASASSAAPPQGGSMKIAKSPHLEAEQTYHKGWFEVQDEGSQIVSLLCGAQQGMKVLDYCAGGGGKTLAMAAQMHNKGQIYAYDADRLRLAGLYPRIERSGAPNITAIDPKRPELLADLLAGLDLVVVDAPCTGSGTWRRKPDSKWRLSEKQMHQRMKEQRDVLAEASAYVKRGGVLAYITCSLLPQENREQLGLFLSERTDFQPLKFEDHVDAGIFNVLVKHIPNLKGESAVTLLPSELNTDGFFVGLMRRV